MKDISIIVPVYNAEKYLVKCLDSLVNQTKKNIEIILVNDGSKDKSIDILNEYKEKYEQLKKDIESYKVIIYKLKEENTILKKKLVDYHTRLERLKKVMEDI